MLLLIYHLVCAALTLAGLAAAGLLSAPTLPAAGPFAVGSTELGLARAAETAEHGAAAQPQVRIWYPLTREIGQLAAPRRLPVLLYFPDRPGRAAADARLVHELASHGYVVAVAEYPTPPARLARVPQPLWTLWRSATDPQGAARRDDERLRARARDAVAILDRLQVADAVAGRGFTDQLESGRAGILGLASGGDVAAAAYRLDRRFVAAVVLNGRWPAGSATSATGPPPLTHVVRKSVAAAADRATIVLQAGDDGALVEVLAFFAQHLPGEEAMSARR